MIVIRPIELVDANGYIQKHHRHHKPVVGHRFSLSAWKDGIMCGVAIVGRPVARNAGNPLEVVEVTRLCTDGTKNACSFLYSAAARVAKEMGYLKIQTYVLESEHGTSLKAAGWTKEESLRGGRAWEKTCDWSDASQGVLFSRNRTDQPFGAKWLWTKTLGNKKNQMAV